MADLMENRLISKPILLILSMKKTTITLSLLPKEAPDAMLLTMSFLMVIRRFSRIAQKIWLLEMKFYFIYMVYQKNFTIICSSYFNRPVVVVRLKPNLQPFVEIS